MSSPLIKDLKVYTINYTKYVAHEDYKELQRDFNNCLDTMEVVRDSLNNLIKAARALQRKYVIAVVCAVAQSIGIILNLTGVL